MGLGKTLLGAVCAVGAVVAAPVILPAVASTAVGGAIAGAASAAGAAAASTTVGSAIVGTAGAIGTAASAVGAAAATTTVGSAVVGATTTAAAAVGTTIGTAAGAAGLTGVAAVTGTSAGAAGLGAVSTAAAVAGGSITSGMSKNKKAKELSEHARHQYNSEKLIFDKEQSNATESLKKLGEEKIKFYNDADQFVDIYKKINNIEKTDADINEEYLSISITDIKNIKTVNMSLSELSKNGIQSIAAGNLIGIASAGSFLSGATASTGTAIASLNGAAATNASLAALGGGAKAIGGLGMAGGQAMLTGLTFAPMLAVGGLLYNHNASKAVDDAYNYSSEVDKSICKMKESVKELKKVTYLSDLMTTEIIKWRDIFVKSLKLLDSVVNLEQKCNYKEFTYTEKKNLETAIKSLKMLKKLSELDLVDNNKVIESTYEVLSSVREERV